MNINAVVVDFETRSMCDLKTKSADNYAQDPSTQVLCCAFYDLLSGNKWLWFPHEGELPQPLCVCLASVDFIMAMNARFDQLIWECVAVEDHGFPLVPKTKWYDVAAQCRVNALPGSLDKAARALGGKHKKDHKGGALIRKFSIPNKEGVFNEMTQADRAEMGDYCMKDVLATVGLVKGTRLMTPDEHNDWQVNERINDRGVLIDVELAELATQYAGAEKEAISRELNQLTHGKLTKHTQHQRVNQWVRAQVTGTPDEQEILNLMTVHKGGDKRFSLDKSVRENILALADAQSITISDAAYDVILAVDEGNKSSVAKFGRMVDMADEDDGRVRGAFIYAGAGQTKRYSSKGMQVHNFKRDCFKAVVAESIKNTMQGNGDIGNVMHTLSKLLRPAIIPAPGKVFVVGDWSAIEGRFLPWLSQSAGGDEVLDVFRSGEDIYVHTANSMNIDDRQIGKVATLALGYQGGVNAFASMGRNYGLQLPEAQTAAIVKKWRGANQWAVEFWKQLERAAIMAVKYPNQRHKIGRLAYQYVESLMGGTLVCILPNGSAIQYPFAKLENIQTDYGVKATVTYLKASLTPAADAKEWPRGALYGGLMAENCTQAVAAALLQEKLRECPDAVMHVHDEIVLEVPTKEGKQAAKTLQECMENVPKWCEGLPLKAVPEIMTRYGK